MLDVFDDAPTVDAAGLCAFRAIFGAVMLISMVRFVAMGWVESVYLSPTFHFSYVGFEWATVPSPPVVWGVVVVAGTSALALAVGLFPRAAAAVFFVTFTYMELWDRTTYLNHYYLVSLVSLLLAFAPTAGYFSVRPSVDTRRVRRLNYVAIAGLVGLVYLYAGIAKLNADWLLRAQPLETWLAPYAHWLPVAVEPVAYAMSWGGALFDLSIAALLVCRRTRGWAFGAAVVFHMVVGALFPIGVFPLVMIGAITIFFAPDWPRRFIALPAPPEAYLAKANPHKTRAVVAYLAVQAVIPLRSYLYPGDANWNDDGFKWSWRVMLVERVGTVEFDVVSDDGRHTVYPRESLSEQQYKMLTVTPDMMLEYAHHLERRSGEDIEVYARSFVAFNGRRSRRWIDPSRDLTNVPRWAHHDFVLPLDSSSTRPRKDSRDLR